MISNSQRKKLQEEELRQRIQNEARSQQSRINFSQNVLIPAIVERPTIEVYETVQQQQDLFKRNLAKLGIKYDVIDAILPMLHVLEIEKINTFGNQLKNN
jgi:hypothetical protein